MCFQVKDVLDSMHKDSGESESQKKLLLRVDGGAAVNNLLMQIQVWTNCILFSMDLFFLNFC